MRQCEDESDSDEDQAPYQPDMDIPPLDENQAIENFTRLVLMQKKKYMPRKEAILPKITFKTQIPQIENIEVPEPI